MATKTLQKGLKLIESLIINTKDTMKIVLEIKIIVLCFLLIPWQVYSQSTGDLLIPRYGLTATTDGTWIYVYGGAHVGAGGNEEFTVSGLLAAYERINPNTLESEYYAEGLHRRANHSSVFINGGILSCGDVCKMD